MATFTSSFTSVEQIYTAVDTLNDLGVSMDYVLAVGQESFDGAYYGMYSYYTYSSNTQVSVKYSRGDTATLYGANLLTSSPRMTQLNTHFIEGDSITLSGSVNMSETRLSGSITQIQYSTGTGSYLTLKGKANVNDSGGSISSAEWSVTSGGVTYSLGEMGSMPAQIWDAGSYYDASHSGRVTSGYIKAGLAELRVSGISVDANTSLADGKALLALLTSGNDKVSAAGAAGAFLYGGAGADKLTGGAGADTLMGGAGEDKLTGGGGADLFVLDSLTMDSVLDFSEADTLVLDTTIFTQLAAATVSNLIIAASALDSDDYLLYDSAKGKLYYDADGSGSGAAVQIAGIKGTDAKTLTFDDLEFQAG